MRRRKQTTVSGVDASVDRLSDMGQSSLGIQREKRNSEKISATPKL